MGQLYVVVGGQFGSEGKGAVTGRICSDLASLGRRVINVRVGGPNAGHTVIGGCPPSCGVGDHKMDKHPWRLRAVPVAAVCDPDADLVIAAGSEIDPRVLAVEVAQLDAAGYGVSERLYIDWSATVLKPEHIEQERDNKLQERIGSTAKGIGAARSARVWRHAQTWGEYVEDRGHDVIDGVDFRSIYQVDSAQMLGGLLDRGNHAVVVEGTQGYGLGLHTDNYPHVTSGDCRAIDFLSQAGLNPWQLDEDLKVVVCYRPHPIRVAGDSGTLRGETSWEALGLPVEHTTVTQKVRRVGTWDPNLARAAWVANGGSLTGGGVVWAALTMVDSVDPGLTGLNTSHNGWSEHIHDQGQIVDHLRDIGAHLDNIGTNAQRLGYIGTGPDTALVNSRMYH